MIITEDSHFTYIIRCSNGTLYTGYTNDLKQRIAKHNIGKGAKFTRGKGPVELVYFETFQSKSQAMIREAKIKKMKRSEKLKLISGEQI